MKSKRWNFEASESSLMVCRDNHDKGSKCEYEPISPSETLELIDSLRDTALRLRSLIEEADRYLGTNNMTNIAHGSILHRKFKDALSE